jgi:Bacterial PH domain
VGDLAFLLAAERRPSMSTTAPPAPVFDRRDQLDRIAANLLKGEFIIAVYDATGAGTGFIGLTNKRVVIQDNSFVGKKVALTSIPYPKINSVAFVSDQSMMGKFFSSSSISVSSGGQGLHRGLPRS